MTPHEAWTGENHKLTDPEFSGVKRLYKYPKMRERNWVQNPGGVFA